MRALVVVAVTVAAVAVASPADAGPVRPSVACPTEDSGRWCVWDARHAGNGHGRSFWVDRQEHVHYVSHPRAHQMIRAGRS